MARSEVLDRQWALYYDKEYALAFEETLAFVDKLQGSDLRDAQRRKRRGVAQPGHLISATRRHGAERGGV